MKLFLCLSALLCLTLAVQADVKANENLKEPASKAATDKSSESKPKRDASLSLAGGGYSGPSYKYLPPSSSSIGSSYDSYPSGYHYQQPQHSVIASSVGYAPASALGSSGYYAGAGHHGASHGHHLSHSSSPHSFGSYKGHGHGIGGHSYSSAAGGQGIYNALGYHGYASGGGNRHLSSSSGGAHHYVSSSPSIGHGYASAGNQFLSTGNQGHYAGSGIGSHGISSHAYSPASHAFIHKSPSIQSVPTYSLSSGHVGSGAGLGSGYHYSKGIGGGATFLASGAGSFPSSSSASSGSAASFANHGGYATDSYATQAIQHNDDHIHNGGGQEHHYITSASLAPHISQSSNALSQHGASSSSAAGSGYNYENPSATYLPPQIQQHPLPADSYGVPINPAGSSSYATKYNGPESSGSPIYAAGHKGLGHFGFTASKPKALTESTAFKTPAYSKAPFKPSTFLGAKYEGGAAYNGDVGAASIAPSSQYLTPSSVSADSSGYDYQSASGPSVYYREQDLNGTPNYEPEATYLPPNSNSGAAAYGDIPSAADGGNYLTPGNVYGTAH